MLQAWAGDESSVSRPVSLKRTLYKSFINKFTVEKSIKEVQTTAQKTNTAIEILDSDRRREKVIAKLPYAKDSLGLFDEGLIKDAIRKPESTCAVKSEHGPRMDKESRYSC
ncbi:hypothetical protein TSTA_059770 [Talaromyces stipitatus ATCC 10500]|uniref:Uncharacterized protein n=1 Tax=Talaromyces stipitatus (strain ATCC 10500 / CBS 375.48 / QM 6759 / NRRL 1006) TaxID=441959 RepID=B8LTA5_TALSN|nr:uncharacterized protein TSTA_059770 [Talaromyces stipitatus ATCC 10500]EED22479.1 hypothetical protein TSTA_059770 [Talaromyces stipitatus ATCC 10500]